MENSKYNFIKEKFERKALSYYSFLVWLIDNSANLMDFTISKKEIEDQYRSAFLAFLRPKSFILDLVYISKSRQARLAVNGRTLLSATATCSGCFEQPLRASEDSKVESSIKSAVEEARRPFVFTLMSTSPGIFPLRPSSPSLIEGVVQTLKTAKSRL